MTIDLGNVITAMVTPFKADKKLSVDLDGAELLANKLLKHGTDTLLLTGSTGEDAQLSPEEKWAIVERIRRYAPQNAKIMVSTGDTNTNRAIAKTCRAFELGADVALVAVPEYIKPTQKAMIVHFSAISKAANNKPIMIYNIPGRTSAEMLPETVAYLASENTNIIGIKQSCGNLDRVSEMKAHPLLPKDFKIYSGDDSLTLPMLALGAKGVISVASHLQAPQIQRMIQEFKKGNVEQALQIHNYLFPLFRGLFIETNPLPIKEALYQKGLIDSPVLRTLGRMDSDHRTQLTRILRAIESSDKRKMFSFKNSKQIS